ncbi:hypothetical protein BJX99DRAFT_131627 [Aspergillus californicus]
MIIISVADDPTRLTGKRTKNRGTDRCFSYYFLFNLIIALASYDTALPFVPVPQTPRFNDFELPFGPTTIPCWGSRGNFYMIPGLLLLASPSLQDFSLACAYCGAPPTPLCGYQLPAAVHFLPVIVTAFPLSSIGPMRAAAFTVTVSRWSTAIIANNKTMHKKELASGWIARTTCIRELAPNLALLEQLPRVSI